MSLKHAGRSPVAALLTGGLLLPTNPATAVSGSVELTIRARHGNLCLDVVGASTSNGARVQQWICNGANQQRWRMEQVGNGDYYIRNVNSGKCLDVKDASKADGAVIQQWDCNQSRQQRFYIYDEERIAPTHSWKCLDVTDASTNPGARIQQWTCLDGYPPHQSFY